MSDSNSYKIASLFLSMQIGKSGGAGKVHATTGKILSGLGHEVYYLQMEDIGPRYDHKGTIVNLDLPFHLGFGIKKIRSWLLLSRKVARRCNKNNIDIILGHGDFFFMVTGVSKFFGNTSHCVGYVHTTIRIRPKHIQNLLSFCLYLNDSVICISEEEKKYLGTMFMLSQKKKITLIHNAIDVDFLLQQAAKPLDKVVLGSLFHQDKFTYISVGRFTHQKDFKLLLDAFIKAYTTTQSIQLVIVGDGDEYDELSTYVDAIGFSHVIFLIGSQNNPLQYIHNADCFVMSSKFEGFPMVLLEACVCGLPLISMDCPTGPAELLGENNEGGILVSYSTDRIENINGLADALCRIQSMDLKSIGDRNRKIAQEYNLIASSHAWKTLLEKKY